MSKTPVTKTTDNNETAKRIVIKGRNRDNPTLRPCRPYY